MENIDTARAELHVVTNLRNVVRNQRVASGCELIENLTVTEEQRFLCLMDDQLGANGKVFFLVLMSEDFITAFVLDNTNSFYHFLIFPFYLFFFVICSVNIAKTMNNAIGPTIAIITDATVGTWNAYARIE